MEERGPGGQGVGCPSDAVLWSVTVCEAPGAAVVSAQRSNRGNHQGCKAVEEEEAILRGSEKQDRVVRGALAAAAAVAAAA